MKINFLYCLLSFVLLFSACSQPEKEIPENIIKKDEMAAIIIDLHVIDAAISLNTFDMSDSLFDKNKLYAQMFKQHNTNRKKFNESMKYYSEHLSEMSAVYTEVMIGLSKKQAEINK